MNAKYDTSNAEIIKLKDAGFSVEEISDMLGARRERVRETIRRLDAMYADARRAARERKEQRWQ